MERDSIKQFVHRLCRCDEDAYRSLLDRYERGIYRFFYFSHGNSHLAQEQSAETFAKFVTAIKKFKANKENSLAAFIFGIARNVLLKSYRKRNLKLISGYDEEVISSEKAGVLRQLQGKEHLSMVMAEVEKFEQPQRQIFVLRFVEQMQIREIAEVMAMAENTVKSHIYRARKKLAESLQDKMNYEV